MRQNRSFITTRSWVKHASVGMAAALFLCTLLPKSSNYEGSASGAGGHLDVCLPGRVTVKRPSSQPSTPLGFGPCGSCLQSQWLESYLSGVVVQ